MNVMSSSITCRTGRGRKQGTCDSMHTLLMMGGASSVLEIVANAQAGARGPAGLSASATLV